MKQETGNWKPYNVRAITNNVQLVFKSLTITKLNEPAYKFITLHLGFIAHYNLQGFQDVYADLRKFALRLQTSEYSNNSDHNSNEANRQETDKQFAEWYGKAYQKSKAEIMRNIVNLARQHQDEIEVVFDEKQKADELAIADKIVTKYGLKITA